MTMIETAIRGTERNEKRDARRAIENNRAALVNAHQNSNRPADTVAALVKEIGFEAAAEIVAVQIVAAGNDGRISGKARAWAAELVSVSKADMMDAYIFYADAVHKAHIDQIARAMMEYQPEPEKPAEAAEKPAEAKRAPACTLANSRRISGLHFTTKHSGKMAGMVSISTSVTTNERCAKNAAIPGSICEKCFAAKQMRVFPSMEAPMVENQRILTGSVLPVEKLPALNCLYFRFEAFGDLNSAVQVKNYFNLCHKNPRVKFALWTKNPDYIAEAIADGYEKPENLNIVLSSLFLNRQRKNPFPFVDKVFTVYDPEHIAAENVEINCGAKSCFDCGLCYEKNGVSIINEKLK